MPFKPGQSGNPRGPKKGYKSPKTLIVDALRESFHKVGGAAYLARQAEANPKAYLALMARDVVARVEEKSDITQRTLAGEMRDLAMMSDAEIARLAHAVDAVIVRPSDAIARGECIAGSRSV